MLVPEICTAKGCKIGIPAGLAAERMCILHFTLFIEQECADMRRESALGKNSHERHNEFMQKIADARRNARSRGHQRLSDVG